MAAPPADAARLAQALGNLVNNAIKYSPKDSAIRLGTVSESGRGWLIVKQLVEAQEGQVHADFPAAGVSRFRIGFPAVGSLASLDAPLASRSCE